MANIGLRYAAFARIQSHTEGSTITYGAGREVGMMISANVAITRNSNQLRANDVVAEEDNSISSAQITINTDDLTLDNEQFMCGGNKVGEGEAAHYQDTDEAAPLGGFGYIRVRSKTDQSTGATTRSYIATWWYKVRAGIESETANTKGNNIEWTTPVVILRAMGSYIDDSDKLKFRDRQQFATYAEAKQFINNHANIAEEPAGAGN